MEETSLRQSILDYAADTYGTHPEYLWKRYPAFAVLRHEDNRKWYALLGQAPCQSLGLDRAGTMEVLNVKCSPVMMGSLLCQPGYYPAYHMNKQSWLSVLLDGTVPLEDVTPLLDLSFQATAIQIHPRKGKKHPPEP